MGDNEIVIDKDAIEILDLPLVEDIGEGKASLKDMVAFLDRVVVGGVKGRKLSELRTISVAVSKAIEELANPKETEQVSSSE